MKLHTRLTLVDDKEVVLKVSDLFALLMDMNNHGFDKQTLELIKTSVRSSKFD